ncbi:hypothetical protein PP713_10645 [Mycobacterium sp. CSUR Q5927]|nr:hypothetical protein [Mycobacterium sp. CSUR Q5927]
MKDVDAVIDEYSGRSHTVLLYTQTVKRLADAAKRPGFTTDDWAPLTALVDTGAFERVGNFKEVMNWTQYLGFLSSWAPSSQWEASFKRVSEIHGVVFLELEERSEVGDFTSVVNSLSVYEFTDDEKISHIDLYLQMALPDMEMLDSYQAVEISE